MPTNDPDYTEAERLRIVLSGGPHSPLRAEFINSFVNKLMTDDEYRQQVIDRINGMRGDYKAPPARPEGSDE